MSIVGPNFDMCLTWEGLILLSLSKKRPTKCTCYWICWTKEHDGVVNARGAVLCIMGGGKAVPSAGASFAREYDSGTWRQLTEGGPPAKTVAPSLALSRIWNSGQSKEWGHKENSTSLSGWVRTSGVVEVVVACFGQERGFGQSFGKKGVLTICRVAKAIKDQSDGERVLEKRKPLRISAF